ncbi:M23 family metallopeptidase [Nevskia ramosa]|uniref:M23 family metallopeptidase n=1 Tax=Nevskia ramosa TaxID=64002 RepID=UPI0003B6DD25|nr:M23 family metallopeptidase [Nevskia ramosa]
MRLIRVAAAGLLLVSASVFAAEAAAPYTLLKGEWEQGGLLIGKAAPGSKLSFEGQTLKLSDDGRFVIGLDRDAKPEVELRITPPGGVAIVETHDVAKREWDVQALTGIEPKFVDPPAKVQKRIAAEQVIIKRARTRDTAIDDFATPFIWPAKGRISGVFGSQRVLNGKPKSPHYGVDVAVPVGTPLVAAAGGIVSLAEPDLYFTGGTVFIDHGHGLQSVMVHMSRLDVKVGDRIEQGQQVGLSGATGRVTGPHLHWGLYWFEQKVDAQKHTGPMPAN